MTQARGAFDIQALAQAELADQLGRHKWIIRELLPQPALLTEETVAFLGEFKNALARLRWPKRTLRLWFTLLARLATLRLLKAAMTLLMAVIGVLSALLLASLFALLSTLLPALRWSGFR